MSARRLGFAALLALLLAWPPPAWAGLSDALILVSRPQLRHPIYARTVLVVAPFGVDQHYGFTVNRPTRFRLGDMFPGHAPSGRAVDRIIEANPRGLWEELARRAQRSGELRVTSAATGQGR